MALVLAEAVQEDHDVARGPRERGAERLGVEREVPAVVPDGEPDRETGVLLGEAVTHQAVDGRHQGPAAGGGVDRAADATPVGCSQPAAGGA